MEFQNGSQDIHPLTSLSSYLHFSDIMLEQCEEGVIAKAPGLQRSSTMVQKVWWQDIGTCCFLNQKSEKLKCCCWVKPLQKHRPDMPRIAPLTWFVVGRGDFHGSPPHHLRFKWKRFPVTEDEKWMQCVIFSPYSFLLPSPPLHCFLLDFVYNNVENYLHPKRTKRVLSLNSNDTTFR